MQFSYDFYEYTDEGELLLKSKIWRSEGWDVNNTVFSMETRTAGYHYDRKNLICDDYMLSQYPDCDYTFDYYTDYSKPALDVGFGVIGMPPSDTELLSYFNSHPIGWKLPTYMTNSDLVKQSFKYTVLGTGSGDINTDWGTGITMDVELEDYTGLEEHLG